MEEYTMNENEFRNAVISELSVGYEFKNPKKGTSKVMKVGPEKISYKRKNSTTYVSIADFYNAYRKFNGCQVSSTDLRMYAPRVFDSNASGDSCNCTFFFMLLHKLGLASELQGEGVRGNPYSVNIWSM